MSSQHKTSDFMKDRHPYMPEKSAQHFAKKVHPHEVSFNSYYFLCFVDIELGVCGIFGTGSPEVDRSIVLFGGTPCFIGTN